MNLIPMMRAFLAILMVGRVAAHVCSEGVTNDTNISTRTSMNNPLFVQTSSGVVFSRYDTPLLDATEPELVALEYTGRYQRDTTGSWWVISQQGKPISRMTVLYGENFVTLPSASSSSTFEYEYNATEYVTHCRRFVVIVHSRTKLWSGLTR